MTGLGALLATIASVDGSAARAAAERHDELVKPPGSLGRIEDVGAQLAAIAARTPPPVPSRPVVVVAAGDHGVHAQGVTPWPQQITAAMVGQFAAGRASVNAVAATVGAEVEVLDVGVAGPPVAGVRDTRVRPGTADLTEGPAMAVAEARAAVAAGAAAATRRIEGGADLLVTGDMGIANTTASACLVAALAGVDATTVTGRGAGIDDATLDRKRGVVAAALARHAEVVTAGDPLPVLAALGGLEQAALAGVLLAGAAHRVPVVLDGVITNAAALVAARLCPDAAGYWIAGTRSPEPAAAVALEQLGLEPLLDLGLRLGEGTGGLLAVPLVVAAARVLCDVAAIDDLDL